MHRAMKCPFSILALLAAALLFMVGACHAATYTLGTAALTEGPSAGTDSVVLTATPETSIWTAAATASWLHVSAGSTSGTGSVNVIFTFDANNGTTRT